MIYNDENIPDEAEARQLGGQHYALWAMRCSLAIVCALVVLKVIAAFSSNSVSMMGSLIDSLGDCVISIIAYASIKISLTPADEDHRHGHGKAEGFSALLQSSFLFGSAVFLTFEAIQNFAKPNTITDHWLAIGISAIAIGATFAIVRIQRHALERAPSLALEGDMRHYTGDLALNAGVITALLLNYFYGIHILDPIIGLLVATYIGYSGYEIGQKAADMLMDKEIGKDQRDIITHIIEEHPEVRGFHDLRTRRSGMTIYISFDVELDSELSLKEAHDISRDLEFSLLAEIPHAEIIIHKDPADDTYDTRHKVKGVHT